MTRSFVFLFILAALSFSSLMAQKIEKSKIIGTWTIKSHSQTLKDTTTFLKFQPWTGNTYVFHNDQTFMQKFYGKASDMAMSGNWKIDEASNKIELYNVKIHVASPPPFTTQKRSLKFIEFSDSTFKIKEFLNGDNKQELSIYSKVSN